MQLNLGRAIEEQRKEAVAQVTALARQAHQAHENAGGYDMAMAEYQSQEGLVEDRPVADASIEAHVNIQAARRLAIHEIAAAPHGAALGAIVQKLKTSLGL